jgi:hypothetical protein
MRYSWDEQKNRSNVVLHGITFDDAERIFEGPTVEQMDDRFDYGEIRVYAIGLVNGRKALLLAEHRRSGRVKAPTGTVCGT